MNENLKLTDVSEFKKRFVYKFESGDDIYSLAKRFHTTVTAIIADNALTSYRKNRRRRIYRKADRRYKYYFGRRRRQGVRDTQKEQNGRDICRTNALSVTLPHI